MIVHAYIVMSLFLINKSCMQLKKEREMKYTVTVHSGLLALSVVQETGWHQGACDRRLLHDNYSSAISVMLHEGLMLTRG